MESNLNVLIKEKKLEIVEYVTTTLVPLIVGDYRMAISLDDAINAIENTFAGLDENDKFLESKLNIISSILKKDIDWASATDAEINNKLREINENINRALNIIR
ncbi:hypothetical protein GIJ48_06320 [Escherichia coli]|uniref:Uncharacterized protein n=1 Tax=Providencia hangzhouensis TaxID=3031799 RepID=A0ABY9Z4B5_9GAMM|nr:hypothetical protein [Providencia hangzhouensis]MRF66113.1 hypothetical protein [Escherichia coli]WNK22520.1 hypothetical protein PZ638_11130 [Providencia hangzhouensis]